MSILYLSNEDVAGLVDIKDAVSCLDDAFRVWNRDGAANVPRVSLPVPEGGALRTMMASYPSGDCVGYKASLNLPGRGVQHLMLYSISQGRLIAMIEAGLFGALRTGAVSGVATRYLAREDSSVVGLIGAGGQARQQLAAMVAVRPVAEARVFSRGPEGREDFARDMAATLGISVSPVASVAAAVEGVDIIVTATRGAAPVLTGELLGPGVHINAMGANAPTRREMDDDTVLKADIVVVDDIAQSRKEAGVLIDLVRDGRMSWDDLVELGVIVQAERSRRTDPWQITLFHSVGIGFEDVAFGHMVYERAVKAGAGRRITLP